MNHFKLSQTRRQVSGFTWVELLFLVAAIGILIGLFLPSMRTAREAARRMSCSGNFNQLSIAMLNYHSAYNQLPPAMGGTGRFDHDNPGTLHWRDNAGRLSGLVVMLPFFEEQALWTQITAPVQVDDVTYPAMGPAPTVPNYHPWRTELSTLRCPSDPGQATQFGLTNYVFCIGDAGRDLYDEKKSDRGELLPPRGVFSAASQRVTRFSDVLDGLSNTIAMIEIANNMDRSVIGQYAVEQPGLLLDTPGAGNELIDPNHSTSYLDGTPLSEAGRGGRWADGTAGVAITNTIMPPNHISFAVEGYDAVDGIYTGSSYHQGGTHVLMTDGAVKFVTDSIESGDLASPAPSAWYESSQASPYGLWGALGTAASEDKAELDF